MGWSSGTDIVRDMATAIRDNVTDEAIRRKLYDKLVHSAQSLDWDCEPEARGIDPILDEVLGYGPE